MFYIFDWNKLTKTKNLIEFINLDLHISRLCSEFFIKIKELIKDKLRK